VAVWLVADPVGGNKLRERAYPLREGQGLRGGGPGPGMTVGAYVGGVTESTENPSADDQPADAVPFRRRAFLGDLLGLHNAAAELIAEAWKALADVRVVPCSDYRPFIRVGRDYEGIVVMNGPAMLRFTALLEDRYPSRFQARPGEDPRWDASLIAFSFIEACVAAMSQYQETGDAPGEAFDETVIELADYLAAADTRVWCARRVSHLMTPDRQGLTIAGVTILAHERFEEARQIRRLIPTAASAFNGDRPRLFAPPMATLVSHAEGPDPFRLQAAAGRSIDRFLLALRLLLGTTAASVYQVVGEATSVCRQPARVDVFPHDEHPGTVRPAIVSPATVQPVEKLLALYDATERLASGEAIHGLVMAEIKFTDSFSPKPWYEKIVDLATALEATLSGTDKTDVTLRICNRAAQLLATGQDPPKVIFADVKALYDLRSSLVHGAAIKEKELSKLLGKVSCVTEETRPRMQTELAVDRLRDLVRRSILLRLTLSSEGRWPLRGNNPPPVDQVLTDAAEAMQWRDAWQQAMADLGAPEAAQPPRPLCHSIFDDYPGKRG
jgi:hypothetical protein